MTPPLPYQVQARGAPRLQHRVPRNLDERQGQRLLRVAHRAQQLGRRGSEPGHRGPVRGGDRLHSALPCTTKILCKASATPPHECAQGAVPHTASMRARLHARPARQPRSSPSYVL